MPALVKADAIKVQDYTMALDVGGITSSHRYLTEGCDVFS